MLTAGNGAGKTSLLACLRRIGYPQSFPVHFPASLESERLDDISQATVTYRLQNETVEYAYRGARWAPRPRKNSHLLADFGYPQVIYLGATAERLTPRPEDFVPRRARVAAVDLVKAANQIFETDKFNSLHVINLTTGGGNPAFLLKVQDNPVKFHSEKSFSLGELCVLKLIDGIRGCPNQSLVLIDELEIALHPRAQIQLYRYIESVAQTKQLTVIFSTHSVSLIKSIPRNKLMFMERDEAGDVTIVRGCFPTYAIGNITLGEEKAPDTALYVEDDVAKAIVEPLVKLCLQDRFAANNLFPDVRVIPIGPFNAVVQFLTNHGVLLPEGTRGFALLDEDVKTDHVEEWRRTDQFQHLADYQAVEPQLDFLPWTPEVAMLSYIKNNRQAAERSLRDALGRAISIPRALTLEADGLVGAALRKAAKRIIKTISDDIAVSVGVERDAAMRKLCQIFARHEFESNKAAILALLLPKIA
ncbi:MAG: AAA family ATPase [Devosia sp.]